jgi:hypothetical protein
MHKSYYFSNLGNILLIYKCLVENVILIRMMIVQMMKNQIMNIIIIIVMKKDAKIVLKNENTILQIGIMIVKSIIQDVVMTKEKERTIVNTEAYQISVTITNTIVMKKNVIIVVIKKIKKRNVPIHVKMIAIMNVMNIIKRVIVKMARLF